MTNHAALATEELALKARVIVNAFSQLATSAGREANFESKHAAVNNCPQQVNTVDCGISTLGMALSLVLDWAISHAPNLHPDASLNDKWADAFSQALTAKRPAVLGDGFLLNLLGVTADSACWSSHGYCLPLACSLLLGRLSESHQCPCT